jgi:phosphonoacetaldehyde hydrolase
MLTMQVSAIRLVVFDWAGTIVDHGSNAPIAALRAAFAAVNVPLSDNEARGPMGLPKREHIRELFRLPSVIEAWRKANGRAPNAGDEEAIYGQFLPLQTEEVRRRADLIPGVVECAQRLRMMHIAIGTTTGYPGQIGRVVVDAAKAQGFTADHYAFPDDVAAGRPAPWMIFRIMEATGVYPPSCVVKVGDTVPDIEEGKMAGAWSVGVSDTGSEVGLALSEWRKLSDHQRQQRSSAAAEKLRSAGAHAVIRSVADLPPLIEEFNARLLRGERP